MEPTTPTTYLQRINRNVGHYKTTLQTLAGDEIKALASNDQIDSKSLFIESCKVVRAYYALLRDNTAMDDSME